MRFISLVAFTAVVQALPGREVGRQVAISTITADAHPMTFWPLIPLAATATPLSYASPPSASRVPTSLQRENHIPHPHAHVTSSPSVHSQAPSTPATPSVSMCTEIRGQNPVSTLPAFCRPTLFANAPALVSAAVPTATVTIGANSVPDKVNCCAECAAYYNCFAWRFVPSYVGTPSDRQPAGFDPWRHGSCELAYHTGNGTEQGVCRNGAPSVCPNGQLEGPVDGTTNPGRDAWFEGLYYNGWNAGGCADLGGVLFEDGTDPGTGSQDLLCAKS
ncbi:hypothetical protein F4777DRAFT_579595 [Nemania sp. FL0916]|nr:hypothetical protein F4777DRAFT_579595 [Nemania sp. FL0916]